MSPQMDRRFTAYVLLFLLGGRECIAIREDIRTHAAVNRVLARGRAGADAEEAAMEERAMAEAQRLGPDPAGKLELLYDSVMDRIGEWADGRPDHEGESEASMMELRQHLDQSVLSSELFKSLKQEDVQAAVRQLDELRTAAPEVETLNLFLCKRTLIEGYTDTGMIFETRVLEKGSFSIKCSNKVNILNRGEVGVSIKGHTQEAMVQGIDMLKALTHPEHDDKFPIQMKMCTREGGCQKPKSFQEDPSLAETQDEIFGSDITDRIPIPERLKEFLPRVKHNPTHLFAVCYDHQDECDGMMWVPKNLAGCNGWFKDSDARATLGTVRDAIANGGWFAHWKPKKAEDRVHDALTGGLKSTAKEEGITADDVQEVERLVGGATTQGACRVQQWQEESTKDRQVDHEEVLGAVRQAIALYHEKQMEAQQTQAKIEDDLKAQLNAPRELDQRIRKLRSALANLGSADQESSATMQNKLQQLQREVPEAEAQARQASMERQRRIAQEVQPVQAMSIDRLKDAQRICVEANEAGEGVNCESDETACLSLRETCATLPEGLGYQLSGGRCPSREEMMQNLKAPVPQKGSGSPAVIVPVQTAPVSSGYHYDGRRRRRTSVMLDLLFPPYYYYYQPYCYTWYGSGRGYYAYPIVPNMYGYYYGVGMWSPGFYLLEGMGYMAYYAVKGMMYVGGALVDGIAHVGWSIGNLFSFVGDCKGDSAKFCIGIAIVVAVIVLLVIWALWYYQYCKGNDERCRSWWYRGGRLRTKMRKWVQLWGGLEADVYSRGASFLFDGQTTTTDKCMKKLQWGRQYVRVDSDWKVPTRNLTSS